MKIVNAEIDLKSQYEHFRGHSVKTLSRHADHDRSGTVSRNALDTTESTRATLEQLSELRQSLTRSYQVDLSRAGSVLSRHNEIDQLQVNQTTEPKWALAKRILESFLGKEIKTIDLKAASEISNADKSEYNEGVHLSTTRNIQGFLSEKDIVELRLQEKESIKFEMSASLELDDGRKLDVYLSEDLVSALDLTLKVTQQKAQEIIDPLVINLDGPLKLSTERSEFDLDADGEKESLANFSSNSAFLALDINQNGKIDDGTELFGAITGNGWSELSQYDSDGNGFIDEGDPVYADLVLYTFDGGLMGSLKDKNIDAISLSAVATPMTLRNDDMQEVGRLRSTGFYLTGAIAKTIQQIDLFT